MGGEDAPGAAIPSCLKGQAAGTWTERPFQPLPRASSLTGSDAFTRSPSREAKKLADLRHPRQPRRRGIAGSDALVSADPHPDVRAGR